MGNSSLKSALAALAVAVVACFVWRGMLGLSLYAWDTFPLIAASRIGNASDLVGIFTHELMDGRFPGGHFYRPLVELSFAFDHALWGLDARGYHLTDLLVLAASGALCVRLATRVLGRSHVHWAVLAGLVYVLHPVQFEILPLPPRRADALSALFVLLAVGTNAQRSRWVTALACLCAIASKETGVIAAPLVFAFACAASAESQFKARARAAWNVSWPSFALVVPFLALRTAVLGGLGGGAHASFASAVTELPKVGVRYATLVLCPLPPSWLFTGALALTLAAALVIALVVVVVRAQRDSRYSEALVPRASAFAVLAWVALLIVVTAVSGTYRAWYALPFVAPLALLVALAAAHRKSVPALGRALTWCAIVVLALLQGWASDADQRWSEIRASSDAARELLSEIDAALPAAKPGTALEFDACPGTAAGTRQGVETKKTMIFREYSLSAYAELVHADRALRIEVKRVANAPPNADEVLLLLTPCAGGTSRGDEDDR